MIAIINGRGSGKAKQLLTAAHEAGNSIVLTQDKRALQVKAHSYGFNDITIIDYEDLKNDNYPFGAKLFVHNGDKLLQYLLDTYYGLNLVSFTATTE